MTDEETQSVGLRLLDRLGNLPQYTEAPFTHEKWPGVTILVRSVSVGARSDWIDRINKNKDATGGISKISEVHFQFLKSVCFDESGNQMFGDGANDFIKFKALASEPVDDLFEFARKLSGMDDDAEGEAKN